MVEILEPRQLLASLLSTVVDASGNLTVENFNTPQSSLYRGQKLSAPSKGSPGSIAISFLTTHAKDFGLLPADIGKPLITDQLSDPDTGITHVYLRQMLNNLPILTADMVVNLMPDGSVISAGGSFLSNLAKQARGVNGPKVNAGGALVNAAKQLSLGGAAVAYATRSAAKSHGLRTVLSAPTVSRDSVQAALRYVPTAEGLKLTWNFSVHTTDNQHWYDLSVGGNNSQIVYAADWVDHASYNVIARPNESPQDGGFAVVTDPQDATASPFGWHDTNGVAGAEFTDTRGNNVDAHLDRVSDNVADGTRPSGGASLDFSGFTLDPASAPTTLQNQNIAQLNLFYANNTAHDLFYKYGFNEAAGNFQTNNYGRGGTSNDAVQADGQDAGGTNNANFATPPDGSAGRMQMYLFNLTTPNRDGDLDMSVIYHEYGHGVSNRLTGGPANASALTALQSGGMGEGWSDFFALMFLQRASDTQNGNYAVGNYVLGQPQTGVGIRRYPYSFDMNVNPLTIDAYGASGISTASGETLRSTEVHDTGEIWTSTLWDMNWLLINKYGFESNLQNGFSAANIKGNSLALQLVMDAMKVQPINPSFATARDAILQADTNLHNTLGTPLNTAEINAAFARRGMGAGFIDASSSATSVTPSFAVAQNDPMIVSTTFTGTTFSPFSTVDLNFDQAMNTGSFSVAGDVLSFTGPAGVNLVPSISGFSWTSSTTLRLNLSAAQSAYGAYTLSVGPNILAADDGHAMDNNHNNIPGEAADGFTTTLNLANTTGPDGFGYKTAPYPYESLDLVIGASGVTTLTSSADDASNPVNLGANTFNFYGTTYSGAASLFASANGLVTFGSGNANYVNDALNNGANEPQAAIAPMWDDWRTDVNVSGATDSAVLYKLDTANNRLIIEWSDMASYNGTAAGTFQAILQLNTGAVPGRIFYNYPDLDITGSGSLGASSTIGIKSAGTPGANRLVLSGNSTHPWVGTGKAVETALDVTGPKVSAESFNYQSNQSFTLTFSEDVGPSLSIADFVLTNTTTAAVIASANLSLTYNAATRTATITNTGALLANGNYTLALASAGVTDATGNPLDGDGDGLIGGNHLLSTFVLAGDANRNRTVDFNDFLILQNNFNTPGSFAQGNFNYDGVIDFNDFLILQNNFNVVV
ncbi:MAG: Metalloprotease [Phycisphaerales bacterium]|nr:Metalloprotease [Phycisphaerales bacterium]